VWFPALDPIAEKGYRILAPDHRANGRSDGGDPSSWTVPQMADDVEALIAALRLERPVVFGWSFGSFVAQSHMVRHGSAAAYVLMGTVAEPGALALVGEQLERFEPEPLRRQVTDSWEREATVATPEQCRQLWHDQIPFQVADPTGPLVEQLLQGLAHLAVAPGGDEGLEQERALVVVAVGRRRDEVRTDDPQDVGGVAVERVRREQVVELVGGAGLDGRLQQLGLALEATVDGPGGEARPAGDLLDPGAVVALLGEDPGRGLDQPLTGEVDSRLRQGHPTDNNDYYRR